LPDDRASTARADAAARFVQPLVRAASRRAAEWARAHIDAYERRLRALVEIDSGLDCPEGRERVAALLCEWAEAAGCTTELVPLEAGGHVVATLPGEGEGRVVLLGHHDTVYPEGAAAERPFAVSTGRATGPGVADMKGGLLVGLLTMEALARGPRPFGRVELHSVPDEEVRTRAFGTLDRVRGADAVLVLECGRENGDLVSGRKVGAWLRLVVEGVPAHAGTEPERGRSAVLGLCREVLRCSALNEARPGLTVIAGTVQGGTIANVVPAEAQAMLDVRSPHRTDFDWAVGELERVGEYDGLRVRLEDAGVWPGIEPGPAGRRLLDEARNIAASLGKALAGQTTGGMSDGCWTDAAGIPTLDGFGPVGGRDHSPEEYMLLDSVPLRCGLLAGLSAAIGSGLLAAFGEGRG
jgi:glutamate carboxypeptidase